MAVQRLLGLNPNSTSIGSLEVRHTPVNTQDGVKLCGVVCAYRLLDVIALLEGHTPRSPHVAHRPLDRNIKRVYVSTPFLFLSRKVNS
jgi:hypothetical protein